MITLICLAYMKDPRAQCTIRRIGDLQDNHLVLACFGHRAAYMVMRALHLRDVEHSSWNSLLVEFYRMSVGMSPFSDRSDLSALPIHSGQELSCCHPKRFETQRATCNKTRFGPTFQTLCSAHNLPRRCGVPCVRLSLSTPIRNRQGRSHDPPSRSSAKRCCSG
jgi:hypothetical protein